MSKATILVVVEPAGAVNGITAAAIIHKTMDVPIIFLTGFSEDQLQKEAKPHGQEGYCRTYQNGS